VKARNLDIKNDAGKVGAQTGSKDRKIKKNVNQPKEKAKTGKYTKGLGNAAPGQHWRVISGSCLVKQVIGRGEIRAKGGV